jgi:hypothetical protein
MALDFQTLRDRIRVMTAGRVDDATIEALARLKLRELWDNWSWSFRMADAVLATVAPKTAGTVTLNVDPTKVDGTNTSFAATDVGMELRVGNQNSRYTVTAVNVGAQELTLASAYVGTPFTASSYILQRSVYSLAPDYLDMFSVTYWRRLVEDTLPQLDRYDGRRAFTSQFPFSWTPRGYDSNGIQQIEISPVPSAALGIHYTYRRALPTLVDATVMLFPEYPLIYLCASDALSVKAVELAEANPAAAQLLQGQADKYQTQGQLALAELQFADLRRAGAAKAVRDEAQSGLDSSDWAVSHDLYSPIM